MCVVYAAQKICWSIPECEMTKSYDPVTKILHWLIFALIAAQYAVGEFMPHIGRKTEDAGLVALHMSLGATVLVAIVIAIAWRITHPVPPLPELPRWQRLFSVAVHWGLLGLVLLMTLLGWAATNSRGWPVPVLGLVPLPAIAPTGARWAHDAGDIHVFLVNVLLGLVILHAGAALYHHFVLRDKVLKRMLPGDA